MMHGPVNIKEACALWRWVSRWRW